LDYCPEIWIGTIAYFMTEMPRLANMELHIMDVVQHSVVSEVETTTSLPLVLVRVHGESYKNHPLQTLLLEECSHG
jgi:hypothetical protein